MPATKGKGLSFAYVGACTVPGATEASARAEAASGATLSSRVMPASRKQEAQKIMVRDDMTLSEVTDQRSHTRAVSAWAAIPAQPMTKGVTIWLTE